MTKLFQAFVKITAWPLYFICFRTKTYYQDKKVQNRKLKGAAIVVSNHTSVYDFAVMMFTFPFRMLRCLMAELLFRKKGLGVFLRGLGGIRVDRNNYDFAFVAQCEKFLDKKGLVGVFPESRLPKEGEERPLEFKPSAAYVAYVSDAPVIPMYTNGSYFKRSRARVIIGTPIYMKDYYDDNLSEKDNIKNFSNILREKVIELGEELKQKTTK